MFHSVYQTIATPLENLKRHPLAHSNIACNIARGALSYNQLKALNCNLPKTPFIYKIHFSDSFDQTELCFGLKFGQKADNPLEYRYIGPTNIKILINHQQSQELARDINVPIHSALCLMIYHELGHAFHWHYRNNSNYNKFSLIEEETYSDVFAVHMMQKFKLWNDKAISQFMAMRKREVVIGSHMTHRAISIARKNPLSSKEISTRAISLHAWKQTQWHPLTDSFSPW